MAQVARVPTCQSWGPTRGNDQPRDDAHICTLRDEEAFLQAEDEKPAIIAEPLPALARFKGWFCRKSCPQVQWLFGAQYAVRDPNTFALITLCCALVSWSRVVGFSCHGGRVLERYLWSISSKHAVMSASSTHS
jgi:hypothetical protein